MFFEGSPVSIRRMSSTGVPIKSCIGTLLFIFYSLYISLLWVLFYLFFIIYTYYYCKTVLLLIK